MTTPNSAARPRHWLVALLAIGCLFLGSTGGAVAGSLITGKDVKNNSLTGKDIKDKSLGAADLSPEATAALTGPPGAAGPAGKNGYQFVDGAIVTLSAAQTTTVQVKCPAGTYALGGGVRGSSAAISTLVSGGPENGDEWRLRLVNPTGSTINGITPYVTCTRP
jgi:hypothetical protein